jgi:hypothetical protein
MSNHYHVTSSCKFVGLMILLAAAILPERAVAGNKAASDTSATTSATSAETGAAAGTGSVALPAVLPRQVRFNGVLEDGSGQPLSGVQGVTFALYAEQTGGAPLWLETQNVTADAAGRYTVLLGSMRADGLPQDLFTSNTARWLAVSVNGVESARVLLVSVPYAMKAGDAETLGGLPASAYVLSPSAAGTDSAGLTKSAPPTAAATDGLPTAAAGTAGNIAKFDVDGTTLVNSLITENGSNIGVDNVAR